jgi:hypothetical protein
MPNIEDELESDMFRQDDNENEMRKDADGNYPQLA